MEPKVTSAVTAMKYLRPKTVGEFRRVMGPLGVYRHFALLWNMKYEYEYEISYYIIWALAIFLKNSIVTQTVHTVV